MLKCLLLFSGGLDSILAAKILEEQNIKITLLNFKSYFFGSETALKAAKDLRLPWRVNDFSRKHLVVVKNPSRGYGKNMNPCIDCHLLMLKEARKIMLKEKYDFVATGEVLGERPMSQNKAMLNWLEKNSGLAGYLLRPLSAKFLEPTVLEKGGKINRDKLMDIQGRSRKTQIALAKHYRLLSYPTPAGGCLLTDHCFGQRLKDLFYQFNKCGGDDIELLKYGRHFWLNKTKIIIGRNKEDNQRIENLAGDKDYLLKLKNLAGPTILVRRGKMNNKILQYIKEMMIKYSAKARQEQKVEIILKHQNQKKIIQVVLSDK